jgi:hypothetical protein
MRHFSVMMSLVFSATFCLGTAAQAGGWSGVAGAHWQAKQSEPGSKKSVKSRSAKKSKSSVTFHDGSAESRSERDRRLSRECKGRSNSGVCEGYTR